MELTDGWYMIKTILDAPLSFLVKSGRITVGQKLFIYGAELSGSTEAATPLQAVILFLPTNTLAIPHVSYETLFMYC